MANNNKLPRGVQKVTRTLKDGSKVIRFRVQISRKPFKADRLFDSADEAIEFLNAAKSVTGQNQIKLLEEQQKKEQEIIADFLQNPTFNTYIDSYITTYIDPKYSNYDPSTPEGKFRLRNWKNIRSFYKTIKNTEIPKRPSEEKAFAIAAVILQNTQEKQAFGKFKPIEITEYEINEYIKQRLAKGMKPISIQREITHISNVFKKLKHLDPNLKSLRNPCLDYDKDLLRDHGPLITKKEFRLSDEDRQKLFAALDEYSNPELAKIVKLSLLTAMRRSEIVLLTWDQVHENYIHLKRTKSGKDRIVYLIPEAKELLKTIPKREGNPRLFEYTVLGFQGSFDKFLENKKLQHIKFHGFRKESISNFIEEIGAGNSLLIAEFIGMASVKKLQENYISKEIRPESITSQEEALKSFGHSNPQTTQGHYFSLRKVR